jgi:hypothetical protein
MLIVYAIDTLRAEALLHAASTAAVEAVLAAGRRSRDSGGTATILVNPMRPWHVPRDSDCARVCVDFIRKVRHCGEPHPFALNGDQAKGPLWGQVKAPSYGRGCFTAFRLSAK